MSGYSDRRASFARGGRSSSTGAAEARNYRFNPNEFDGRSMYYRNDNNIRREVLPPPPYNHRPPHGPINVTKIYHHGPPPQYYDNYYNQRPMIRDVFSPPEPYYNEREARRHIRRSSFEGDMNPHLYNGRQKMPYQQSNVSNASFVPPPPSAVDDRPRIIPARMPSRRSLSPPLSRAQRELRIDSVRMNAPEVQRTMYRSSYPPEPINNAISNSWSSTSGSGRMQSDSMSLGPTPSNSHSWDETDYSHHPTSNKSSPIPQFPTEYAPPRSKTHYRSPQQEPVQEPVRRRRNPKKDIKILQEMGFSLEQVLDALSVHKGDVDAAANHLANSAI